MAGVGAGGGAAAAGEVDLSYCRFDGLRDAMHVGGLRWVSVGRRAKREGPSR